MAYTKEQIEKAKTAENVEELIALAKAEEIELSEEKAKAIFAELHAEEAELSDAELDNVAGGCPGLYDEIECRYCHAMNSPSDMFCNNCSKPIAAETL